MKPDDALTLLDYKRAIFSLYAEVRAARDPRVAWERWKTVRGGLFIGHPQSPVPESKRSSFTGPHYFDYDPALRVLANVEAADEKRYDIATSGDGSYRFTRFARAQFRIEGREAALECYWLQGYGGGLFLPFRDATAPGETYGAGRYLLDTVKGADLGMVGGQLVLDFNFAYNPSCAYDPKWVCPLAPPPNRLDFAIPAGERYEAL